MSSAHPLGSGTRIESDTTLRPLTGVDLTDTVAWGLVESAPDGIVMVDERGRIVLVNRQAEAQFGYDRSELLGEPVEVLLPQRLRPVHSAHRTRYRAEPRIRAMGEGMELRGRRQDGTEFPVEISLSPLQADERRLTIATVRDVTGRTEAEGRARRVQATLDAVRDGVFIFDVETLRFTHVNLGAVRQTGYPRDQLLAMTPMHIQPEMDEVRFRQLVAPLVADEVASVTLTTVHRRADGRDVPVEIVLQRPFSEPEGPRAFVAIARDVSERLEAETQVRRVQRTLDAISDAVFICDGETLEFLYVNQGAAAQLGYDREELLTLTLPDVTADHAVPGLSERVEAVLGGTQPVAVFESAHRRADGTEIPVEVLLQRPSTEGGTDPSWLVAVVRDISERVRTQEELRMIREELTLTEDRERIGRDLHDTVIQQLFAMGMSLQAVAHRISPPDAAARVHATIDGLDDTIRDLRTAIFGLQARPDWGDGGVRGSILRLAADAGRSLGFEPAVAFSGQVDEIPEEVADQLLPTLREALANAARHARATSVDVEAVVGQEIVLRVVDDGVGLPDEPTAGAGRGLQNMSARAEALGGHFSVTGGPAGTGTALEWRVPSPG